MRAVRFDHYGDVDVLEVREVEDPVPGEHQLLVRVKAAGINPGEAKIRDGALESMFPTTFPCGEGSDLAGIVEQVGAAVTDLRVGDEVIGFTNRRGSHAELVVVDREHAVRRPAEVPWEVGGALFVAGSTAFAMVQAVSVAAGDTVIVAGATGGVGSLAAQLAALRGATVLGIAGERHGAWLTAHGITHVPYGDELSERLRSAAPAGRIDAVIDCHGDPYVELAIDLGVEPARIDTIVDFAAPSRHPGVQTAGSAAGATGEVMQELVELIAAARLEVPIAATFPLEQVREAYTALAQDHPLGKVVLIP